MLKKILLYISTLIKDIFYKDAYVLLYAKSLKKNNNWGDDIGETLISFLTNRKLLYYRYALVSRFIRHKNNYLIVGSIIPQFSKPDSIIWGSGVGESKYTLQNKPKKVLAVRGPLTRKYLLERGVECPEIYGDPALLFPLFYNPKFDKKYKIGFIPHFLDQTIEFFEYLNIIKTNAEIIFIDVRNYGKWQNFIDLICKCEFIISSSLHGLIIADAYGVPNIWGQFTHIMEDDGFKYHDYFLSVNRMNMRPITILDKDVNELLALKSKVTKPKIDIKPLLLTCPFKKK